MTTEELLITIGGQSQVPNSPTRRNLLLIGLIAANHTRTPEVAEILDAVADCTAGRCYFYNVWAIKQRTPIPMCDELRLVINRLVDAAYEVEYGSGERLGKLVWEIIACVERKESRPACNVDALLHSLFPRVQ